MECLFRILDDWWALGGPSLLRFYVYGALCALGFVVNLWLCYSPLKKNTYLRIAIFSLTVLLFARFILFYNPFAWHFYKKHIPVSAVGWRGRDEISFEMSRYYKRYFQGSEFLSVGSSQSEAVFQKSKSRKHRGYSLGAMLPLEYWGRRYEVIEQRPQKIILYISSYDILMRPRISAIARFLPNSLDLLPMFWGILRDPHYRTDFKSEIFDFLKFSAIRMVFSEVRYAEVVRSFLRKVTLLDYDSNRYGGIPAGTVRPGDNPEWYVRTLRGRLARRDYLELNFSFLRNFISFCSRHGIRVLILEGAVNPMVDTKETLILKDEIKIRLESLAGQFDNVSFYPREKLYAFTSDDYRDRLHVFPESGRRFCKYLEENIPEFKGVFS